MATAPGDGDGDGDALRLVFFLWSSVMQCICRRGRIAHYLPLTIILPCDSHVEVVIESYCPTSYSMHASFHLQRKHTTFFFPFTSPFVQLTTRTCFSLCG